MIPSSTFGCTGPTGLSVLLDTGQDGWVAKHHQGEPLLGRVRELRKWRDNGRAAMVAWMEQVGISLCQRCQAGLEVDHNPYVGVRIGEAAHPGPSGGGARATDRRRQEREADGGEAGLGPLAGLLRPLIEQMLREVLQELLGGAELRNLFSSLLVGGQVGAGTSQAPGRYPGRLTMRRRRRTADGRSAGPLARIRSLAKARAVAARRRPARARAMAMRRRPARARAMAARSCLARARAMAVRRRPARARAMAARSWLARARAMAAATVLTYLMVMVVVSGPW